MKKAVWFLSLLAIIFVVYSFVKQDKEHSSNISFNDSERIKESESKIPVPPSGKQITIEVSSPVKLSESTVSGTLISGYSKDNTLVFSAGFPKTWNSYSASSALGEIHLFVRTPNMDSKFVAMPRSISDLHSAYIEKKDNRLFLFDAPDGGYYPLKESKDDQYIFDKDKISIEPEKFKNLGYEYSFGESNNGDWVVKACKTIEPDKCDEIATTPKAVVFVYGGNEINTVAVTNRGDVLFHNQNGWCRGEKIDEAVKCNKNATAFNTIYKTQLYSSIKTQDGTLLGEYPTGRFWKLGDGEIYPTNQSPYNEYGEEYHNLELQSISMFCGDLYAGFWPLGEIWMRSLESNVWKKIYGLFPSHTELSSKEIPYFSIIKSGKYVYYLENEFFGQRATSMVNYKNSLFVASGNLGAWNKDIPKPTFMSDDQINEYGLIHSKTDSNCLTAIANDNLKVKITIDSNNIFVYNNSEEIAQTKLHDFDIKKIDYFVVGDGVFGKITDKDLSVSFKKE